MADSKHRFPDPAPAETETQPKAGRRRLSRIVHDHKGNATVEWFDAPADYERPMLEIEGAREPATPPGRGLSMGSLALENNDSHDPYMRGHEAERKSGSTTRTNIRELSAWIKMMRSLEEAKKHRDEDD
jgi:hypothetical protein